MSAPADVLDAARAGDPDAFEQVVGPFRAELLAHCYRMLGSYADAEDAVQESLLRAWRSLPGLDARGYVRAWLYKIATNRCLTAIDRRSRRELPFDVLPEAPDTEISWLEPYPDPSPEGSYLARESMELAFVAAMQHLPGTQRAALILRDVLGFSAIETAEQLDLSVAAVNSALQRARKVAHSNESDQGRARAELGPTRVAELAARWVTAWQASDVDAIIAMLTEDARYSMPPLLQWYEGHAAIRAFLTAGPLQSRWRFLPTTANGQLAFGTYLWDDTAACFLPGGLDVLTLREGRVREIVAFLAADLLDFGLPARLDA